MVITFRLVVANLSQSIALTVLSKLCRIAHLFWPANVTYSWFWKIRFLIEKQH